VASNPDKSKYPTSRRYVTEYEVNARLRDLRMPRRLLELAVAQGHLDRRLATPLDLPGRGEYDAASRGLRTLGEEGGTTEGGWFRDKFLGIDVVFRSDEAVAINVTGGDEWTGVDGEEDPVNTALKGPNAMRAAQAPRIDFIGDGSVTGVSFYYLLTNVRDDKLWAELSEPVSVLDGHTAGWFERIILGEIDFNSVLQGGIGEPTAPASPDLDIPVTRRKTA
jgi:hypothetical protein